jgi:hypothetical protein
VQGAFNRNSGRNLNNWKEYLNFVKKNQLFIFSQKLFQVNGQANFTGWKYTSQKRNCGNPLQMRLIEV